MSAARYGATEVARALGVAEVEFLGAGAFGDTWRVDETAVKIICEDGYPPERVAREVSGLMRVVSLNVVKLLHSSAVELGGVARPALTFEYVPGGGLDTHMTSGVPAPAENVEGLLRGLLAGVRDMHAADGTVHRDIKPQNVALRAGDWDQPVILDLGLARATTDSTVTLYPGPIGTAPYMAPEQLKGQRARKAADLFAVGVTVHQAATGEHPFYDTTSTYTYDEALARIAAGPKPLPPTLPAPLVEVLGLLVKVAEYERGSAVSNLKRLDK